MTEHTVKAHGEALSHLTSAVAAMGRLAVSQAADSVRAMARSDAALAQAIVGQDAQLDRMEAQIEHDAIRFIALRQPMAKDLRHTVAAMKIAGNLERCGDLAKNVAKRAVALAEAPINPSLAHGIERIGALATERLRQVMDAYERQDSEAAMAVWRADKDIDQLYDSVFRELLTHMMGDPRVITAGAHLLFVAKNLERIGDHATNVAELIVYELTGEPLPDSGRPKWDAVAEG